MFITKNKGIDENGEDVFVPLKDLLPMVNPDDLGKKFFTNHL